METGLYLSSLSSHYWRFGNQHTNIREMKITTRESEMSNLDLKTRERESKIEKLNHLSSFSNPCMK